MVSCLFKGVGMAGTRSLVGQIFLVPGPFWAINILERVGIPWGGGMPDWVGISEGAGILRGIMGNMYTRGMEWVYQLYPPLQVLTSSDDHRSGRYASYSNAFLSYFTFDFFFFLLSISFIYFVNTIKLKVTTALTSYFS